MPDLMRIGGVTGWLQAAAIADVTGLPMSSHLYPEVSGHRDPVPGRPVSSASEQARALVSPGETPDALTPRGGTAGSLVPTRPARSGQPRRTDDLYHGQVPDSARGRRPVSSDLCRVHRGDQER